MRGSPYPTGPVDILKSALSLRPNPYASHSLGPSATSPLPWILSLLYQYARGDRRFLALARETGFLNRHETTSSDTSSWDLRSPFPFLSAHCPFPPLKRARHTRWSAIEERGCRQWGTSKGDHRPATLNTTSELNIPPLWFISLGSNPLFCYRFHHTSQGKL